MKEQQLRTLTPGATFTYAGTPGRVVSHGPGGVLVELADRRRGRSFVTHDGKAVAFKSGTKRETWSAAAEVEVSQ